MKIFLSHSSRDQDEADALAAILRGRGHQVDDMRDWSGDFMQRMERALDASDRMVAIWSEHYFASEHCMLELRTALNRQTSGGEAFLIALMLRMVGVPTLYATQIWLDFLQGVQGARDLGRLLRQLGGEDEAPVFTFQNLPPPPTDFTGREEAMAALTTRIAQGNAAVTQAIRGLGGVGKTTLALHFAHSEPVRARFPIRWWLPAETEEGVLTALSALAVRLGRAEAQTPPEAAAAAVMDWFAATPRDALLIFDNVEDVNLPRRYAPEGAHILVTTRRPAIPGADPVEIRVWDAETTARYLVDRTGDGDAGAAERLAEALEGLPLAASQAAAICIATGMGLARYHDLFEAQSTEPLDHLIEGEDYPTPAARSFLMALERAEAESAGARTILEIMAALAPEPLPVAVFANGKAPETLQDPARTEGAIAALRKHALIDRAPRPYWLEPSNTEKFTDCVTAHRLVLRAAKREDGLGQAALALGGAFPFDSDTEIESWPLCARLTPHAAMLADEVEEADAPENLKDLTFALNQAAGYFQFGRADYRQAAAMFRAGLRIDEAAHGPNHPDVATDLSNLANVLGDLGGAENLTAAREALERALRIDEAAHGPDHPNVAIRLSNLATVLRDLGGAENLTAAREALERALRISEAALGPDHPSLGIRCVNLAHVLMAQGDRRGALDLARRGHAIFLGALGPEHGHTGIAAELVAHLEGE